MVVSEWHGVAIPYAVHMGNIHGYRSSEELYISISSHPNNRCSVPASIDRKKEEACIQIYMYIA